MSEKINLPELTDKKFKEEVLEHSGLVLVEFVAKWCGYCRIISSTMEQLVVDYQGKIRLFKLDVDQNRKTASEYVIHNLPTIVFFKNGKIVDRITGVFPMRVITEKLNSLLEPSDE